jgi:hypothetical protein
MKFSDAFKRALFHGPVRYLGRKIETRRFRRKPILIVACPRSGTTLLLSILSAVPGIFAVPNQTYAFDRWVTRKAKLIPLRLDKLLREFIINKIPPAATRWLEKTPGHIRSVGNILNYFRNEVQIIHIIRDGRDVTVSTHPAYEDRRKYWVPVDRWVREVKIGLSFKDHPSVYTLRYEDLINNYEGEIRKVVDFLGEPFPEQLINWKEHTKIKDSIHWGTEVLELHSKSIGKWKKPEHSERAAEFMKNNEAVELLKELGYSV